DRRGPRRQHPGQARRIGPGGGGDGRDQARASPDAHGRQAGAGPELTEAWGGLLRGGNEVRRAGADRRRHETRLRGLVVKVGNGAKPEVVTPASCGYDLARTVEDL